MNFQFQRLQRPHPMFVPFGLVGAWLILSPPHSHPIVATLFTVAGAAIAVWGVRHCAAAFMARDVRS